MIPGPKELPRALDAGNHNLEDKVAARTADLAAAHRAARESEMRFRDFAQVASDWYWEMDSDLRFSYVSERVTEVLGIRPEEMVGRCRSELRSPDEIQHPEKWARHAADLKARRPFRGFEYRMKRGERGERYARISGKPVFDENGAFRGYRGVGADITAEVESTAALARSEEEFRNLIEGSIQGIRIMSPDWKPLFVNRAYVRIMGHDSPEEILAQPSFEHHIAPYELPRMREIRRARLEGRPVPDVYEHDAVRKDGSIITLQSSVRRVEWKGEVAIQGTVIDVTDRKRAELALRESERRFRALYDNNPSMYLTLTQEGRIASINRFGADQIGYSIEELVGRELTVLFPDDAVTRLGLCAINLSGHSFGSEEFLTQLLAMLGESKVPPEKICFEVTETVAIANLNRAQRFMKTLAALGCRFSLDALRSLGVDFAQGYLFARPVPLDEYLAGASSDRVHAQADVVRPRLRAVS